MRTVAKRAFAGGVMACVLPLLRRIPTKAVTQRESTMRAPRLFALLSTAWLIAPTLLAAQQARQAEPHVAAVQEERRQVQSEIARLTEPREGSPKSESIDSALRGLRSLDALYAQEEAWAEEKGKLESRLIQEKKELDALGNFTPNEPRPYSFVLLERLKDDLATEQEHRRAL